MAGKMKALPDSVGSFKVIKDLGMRQVGTNGRGRFAIVECPYCKSHKEVAISKYKSNTPKSCGCKSSEFKSINSSRKTHGGVGTRLYTIWEGMRRRCLRPNEKEKITYAGINICKDWNDFSVFREWANNNGYLDTLTLDRIDSSGNYEPTNCRWATRREQSCNRKKGRLSKSLPKGVYLNGNNYSAKITVEGKTFHLGTFKTIDGARNSYNKFVKENDLSDFYSESNA